MAAKQAGVKGTKESGHLDTEVYLRRGTLDLARPLVESVVAEWKTCDHLFLALEKCGASAWWFLGSIQEHEELFHIYDEARVAVQVSKLVPPDHASDMEVALLFYFWPSKVPTIALGIAEVAKTWKTTREMTLTSWLRRCKADGIDGPIETAVNELRLGRKAVIADTIESLWLVDPALAARVEFARQGPHRPAIDVTPNGIPPGISDGSLMRGIQ
jgi:hypothetical protein